MGTIKVEDKQYIEPDHITKIREELCVINETIRVLKIKVKTFQRPTSLSRSLFISCNRSLVGLRKLSNAYHIILKQHNEMKKLFSKSRG